jgi:AraC-like DNA-binding protein
LVVMESGMESDWVTRRPAPRLAGLVDRYIGYRLAGYPAGIHRGLPSRHMTFIVDIGPGIDLVTPVDPGQSPDRFGCVVGGLHASSARIAHDGNQQGVVVELTPTGSRALLGMPSRALWSTSIELSDLVGGAGDELWERLQPTLTWSERFAVCDEVLGRLVDARGGAGSVPPGSGVRIDVAAELRQSWRLLVASAGTMSVSDLASRVGWSRQHLARRFGDEFGLSPKLAARVVRFERARTMLMATPAHVSIAQVAAACGYFDQAHLTRDFLDLAGCTPTGLLVEEELPHFQDTDDGEPHDGGHGNDHTVGLADAHLS